MSVEVPKAPEDQELRNVIDKLAQFVARNGPEFENMTKQKQKDNPQFSFLYGGEHYHYYQYKVASEQIIMKKQKLQQQASAVPPVVVVPPVVSAAQLQALQQQIQESERNLKAQFDTMMQQQESQIDAAVDVAADSRAKQWAQNLGLDLEGFNRVLQPLSESCTKEAIANAKGWLLSHFASVHHGETMLAYLLQKVKEASTAAFRLHVLYLINDVLHHCTRKTMDDLASVLKKYVPQLYCCAYRLAVGDDQREKLDKLIALWDRNGYFGEEQLRQLRDADATYVQHHQALRAEYAHVVADVTGRLRAQYQQYENQHQEFVKHVESQIAKMNAQAQASIATLSTAPPGAVNPELTGGQLGQAPRRSRFDTGPPAVSVGAPGLALPLPVVASATIPAVVAAPPPPPMLAPAACASIPPPPWVRLPPTVVSGVGPPPHLSSFSVPPPPTPLFPPGAPVPLMSMGRAPPPIPPPVGQPVPLFSREPLLKEFEAPQASRPQEDKLVPTVAYYDLPAGLMAPLVHLEEYEYKPLDPKALRLPPPQPPTERLLAAVEAFYSPPNHENPRDSDGWERLGLYEYFQAKERAVAAAKAMKEDNDARSRSPPPRNHRERGRSDSRSSSHGRSRSRSRSLSRSRSRSYSPYRARRRRSRSRSDSRSRSGSPRRRRSMSRSLSPVHSQGGTSFDRRLDDGNRGHQILSRMGWQGGGLGSEERGIQDPIAGGEVRDRIDQYKGLGAGSDPFEQFRRSQSGHYVQKIRAARGDT